jgi:uncharacterized protein (TIGR00369 family)
VADRVCGQWSHIARCYSTFALRDSAGKSRRCHPAHCLQVSGGFRGHPGVCYRRASQRQIMPAKTYGTISPEQQNAMSGLEFVKGLANGELPLNTLAQTLGYDVVEAESGRVAVALQPTDAHLNPSGTVHGGVTAALLDSCMGLAIRSMLEKGFGSTTLEFKISLVRPITPETGQIRAEGKVLNCGRRVGTAEGRVTDAQGRLLAHGTTTCLILK